MKIAIVNQPQDPIVAGQEQRGSVAIVNWELAKRLAQRHEVTVYAPRANGQASCERWRTIQIRRGIKDGFVAVERTLDMLLVSGVSLEHPILRN